MALGNWYHGMRRETRGEAWALKTLPLVELTCELELSREYRES